MCCYLSHSVHSLAKKAASQPRSGSEVTHAQHKHVHTTTKKTPKKRPAVGYWHLLPSDSCSEPDGKQPFQLCSKPHPNTSITTDSQAGISTKRQRGKWSKEQIHLPAADAIPPGKDRGIFGMERREAGRSRLLDAVLGKLWLRSFCTQGKSGPSVDNLAATESCWVSSDVINRRKKKSNKSSP